MTTEDTSGARIYRIIRFRFSGGSRTIRSRVTLAEAQQHCSRWDTSSHSTGPGSWFDGYDYMRGYRPSMSGGVGQKGD
jgi:hypothetical protein